MSEDGYQIDAEWMDAPAGPYRVPEERMGATDVLGGTAANYPVPPDSSLLADRIEAIKSDLAFLRRVFLAWLAVSALIHFLGFAL